MCVMWNSAEKGQILKKPSQRQGAGTRTLYPPLGRQNMLRPYLKIWDWDLIFGRAVKAISSPGVRSPCQKLSTCAVLFINSITTVDNLARHFFLFWWGYCFWICVRGLSCLRQSQALKSKGKLYRKSRQKGWKVQRVVYSYWHKFHA